MNYLVVVDEIFIQKYNIYGNIKLVNKILYEAAGAKFKFNITLVPKINSPFVSTKKEVTSQIN